VPLPCYRSLVPEVPEIEEDCATTGVLGALTGIIGSLQAVEVVKEITGAGESLAGRLLIYDALSAKSRTVKLAWDPQNPNNGEANR
jgi:adenylyltransferase/sulfurtransferase